jgi:hypothetical protein
MVAQEQAKAEMEQEAHEEAEWESHMDDGGGWRYV